MTVHYKCALFTALRTKENEKRRKLYWLPPTLVIKQRRSLKSDKQETAKDVFSINKWYLTLSVYFLPLSLPNLSFRCPKSSGLLPSPLSTRGVKRLLFIYLRPFNFFLCACDEKKKMIFPFACAFSHVTYADFIQRLLSACPYWIVIPACFQVENTVFSGPRREFYCLT